MLQQHHTTGPWGKLLEAIPALCPKPTSPVSYDERAMVLPEKLRTPQAHTIANVPVTCHSHSWLYDFTFSDLGGIAIIYLKCMVVTKTGTKTLPENFDTR